MCCSRTEETESIFPLTPEGWRRPDSVIWLWDISISLTPFSGEKPSYAGALEPIDRNDTGRHGYVEGSWDRGKLRLKFIPFACRSYENIVLTLKEDSTQYSLEEMLKNADPEKRWTEYLPSGDPGQPFS